MPKISVVWHSVCLDRCSSFRRGCLEYVSSLTCRSHTCIGCVGLPAAIGAGLMRYRCCVFESLSRTMMQVPTRRLCIMICSLRVDFIGYICRSGVFAQVVSARAPVPSASAALVGAVDGSVVEGRLGPPACRQRRSESKGPALTTVATKSTFTLSARYHEPQQWAQTNSNYYDRCSYR